MEIISKKIAIDKLYKRRDRYEIPDWQREEVWDTTKKQSLIDSILRGWKLPKFYFQKIADESEEFEVVDGQQRLLAIFEFFDNSLQLSPESTKIFKGQYYRDLRAKISDSFDDFEIEYDEITDAEEEEIKEFFQRLQQGLPLTSSEKLNAVHSNLRNYCRELSNHSFLKTRVSFTDKRYSHFDLVSKVAVVEIEGIDTSLRFDDIKTVFESQVTFSSKSAIADRLRKTFDYLNKAFPSNSLELRNRSITQSIVTIAARIVANGKSAGSEKGFYNFVKVFMEEFLRQVELGVDATDQDYLIFQKSISANVRGGARTRNEIFLRKMLRINPMLAQLFEPTIVAESNIVKDIKRLSTLIAEHVEKINIAHAAKNGTDLFKPTNKTVAALRKIAVPISTYENYKDFIENLYFIFWEGVGERLNNVPNSFTDVNVLRTDLEHDLDHGKKKKISAKRKEISAIFSKYSGAATPATIAPNHFPIVQANLLSSLEEDLRVLIKKI